MTTDNLSHALEIKLKSIIEISIDISAMLRVFEKGSKLKITNKLLDAYPSLEKIEHEADFELFHKRFCDWFRSNIKTARRSKKNEIVRESHAASYGHAAKVLDVALKVIIYYSGLPSKNDAERLLPLLKLSY